MPDYYEYRHVVGFEETNVVGNVYFANYQKWQGRVREMFLVDHAPSVVEEIQAGLKLFTVKEECQYFVEVTALDDLVIRLRLDKLMQTQVVMQFDYLQICPDQEDGSSGEEILIARAKQHIAFMRGDGEDAEPVEVPNELKHALDHFPEAS